MKHLSEYIYDSQYTFNNVLQESMNLAQAAFLGITADNLTHEVIVSILNQYDKKILQGISDILKDKYGDAYFPYEPQKDDYIKDIGKIRDQIADAIINLEKK